MTDLVKGALVFRGSHPEGGQHRSVMSDNNGVYVSTDRSRAAQWGAVKEYRITNPPKLIDLGNYNHNPARRLVASYIGKGVNRISQADFDETAPDIFMQNLATDIVERMGFDGYCLGCDAFLIGDLSDYAKSVAEWRMRQSDK